MRHKDEQKNRSFMFPITEGVPCFINETTWLSVVCLCKMFF